MQEVTRLMQSAIVPHGLVRFNYTGSYQEDFIVLFCATSRVPWTYAVNTLGVAAANTTVVESRWMDVPIVCIYLARSGRLLTYRIAYTGAARGCVHSV